MKIVFISNYYFYVHSLSHPPTLLCGPLDAGRGAEPVCLDSNHAWFYSRNAESAEITSAFNVLD